MPLASARKESPTPAPRMGRRSPPLRLRAHVRRFGSPQNRPAGTRRGKKTALNRAVLTDPGYGRQQDPREYTFSCLPTQIIGLQPAAVAGSSQEPSPGWQLNRQQLFP